MLSENQSDNIEIKYINNDNQITITEDKENAKIYCKEFQDISIKDIHKVQSMLNKDVLAYKKGIKNDIVYKTTENSKGNLKSVNRKGKIETEMKSQRSQ